MKALRYISLAAVLFLSACDTFVPTDASYPIDLNRGTEVSYMVSE